MYLSKNELYVERLIQDAQGEGKFNNLGNQGVPLNIEEENPFLSEEWRMAFKVMENGGYSPPWIELDKEIERELERATLDRAEHLRWLRRRLDDIKYGSTQHFTRDLRRLSASHQHFLKAHKHKLEAINKRIDLFNGICPVKGLLKVVVSVEDVVRKFDTECPAIPSL
jgi:hypothetical protein